jgi:cytochrome P450
MIYNIYFHPLSSYPGPKFYAASRIPYVWAVLRGQLPFICQQLHVTYGDVVRIAPDELSFINPNAWKDIYGHRQGHPQMSKDSEFYLRSEIGVDSLITANHVDHSRFRRLVSHAFSEKALREQESVINGYVDLLIERLHENANGDAPLDIVQWYNWTTFDIVGDLAFGEPFSCLANSAYNPWVTMIFKHVKGGAFITALKRFHGLRRILTMLVPKDLIKSREEHMRMTTEKVAKRLELGTERPDFMSHILRHNDEKGMSFQEIRANANLLILAGSETTATLLSGATYHLLRNPRALRELTDEIRGAFALEEDITMASAGRLEYMLAVLDEALRMYPPVPSGLPRRVPGTGDFINGRWVPGGVCHYTLLIFGSSVY